MQDSEFLTLVADFWKPDAIGFKKNTLTGKIDLVRFRNGKLENSGVSGKDVSECINELKELFAKNYLENNLAVKQQ